MLINGFKIFAPPTNSSEVQFISFLQYDSISSYRTFNCDSIFVSNKTIAKFDKKKSFLGHVEYILVIYRDNSSANLYEYVAKS